MASVRKVSDGIIGAEYGLMRTPHSRTSGRMILDSHHSEVNGDPTSKDAGEAATKDIMVMVAGGTSTQAKIDCGTTARGADAHIGLIPISMTSPMSTVRA